MSRRRIALLVALLVPSLTIAESATFERRNAIVGDAVEQLVRVGMQLQTTSRQGAEVLDEETTGLQRTQRRRVTATSTRDGRVVGADVRFFESSTTRQGPATTDPVAGKAYHCERLGEKLIVTNDKGLTPPLEEYALVVRAMESLGTESPLAEYLGGKTVEVGQKLELPPELAQRALGFDKSMGAVDRFELTLQRVQTVDGRRVASFAASIAASSSGTEQMGLVVEGLFDIEESTCRVVKADLTGPIAMSGPRAAGVAAHQIDGRGKLRIELAARYQDATR